MGRYNGEKARSHTGQAHGSFRKKLNKKRRLEEQKITAAEGKERAFLKASACVGGDPIRAEEERKRLKLPWNVRRRI